MIQEKDLKNQRLKSGSGAGKAWAGRGDMVRLLHLFGDEGLDMTADLIGYRRVETKKERPTQDKKAPARSPSKPSERGSRKTEHYFPEPDEKVVFWHVAQHDAKEKKEKDGPAWIKTKKPFAEGEVCEDRSKTPPKHPPLVSWPQLWPFLRRALGVRHDSRSIDIKEAVRLASELKPVSRFPRKQKNGWAATCRILFDFDQRLTPFWSDMTDLSTGIEKLHGQSGLERFILEHGPEERCRKWGDPGEDAVYLTMPEPGTPILIVSDLGLFDPTETALNQWLRFGKRLNRAGVSPIVLNPCPPRRWPEEFNGMFQMACWDRGRRLPRVDRSRFIRMPLARKSEVDEAARAERLLSLLSPAIWVETSLLRAVRLLLPRGSADAATEAVVWNHEDISACSLGFSFKKDRTDKMGRSEKYLDCFRDEAKDEEFKKLRRQAIEIIKTYHRHFSGALRCEEAYRAGVFPENDIEWAEAFMRQFVATLHSPETDERPAQIAWFNRLTFRQFDHPGMWESEALCIAWGKLNLARILKEGGQLPRRLDTSKILWMMKSLETPLQLNLFQRGEQFVFIPAEAPPEGPNRHGSLVATMTVGNSMLRVRDADKARDRTYPLDRLSQEPLAIPDSGTLIINTDYDEIKLKSMERPTWADGMGRDEDGFFVILPGDDFDQRVYWPQWSERVDYDDYGLCADLKIKGVKQRFRWIRPGKFMMGSPEDEAGRDDDEQLHEVTLTHGFWMAETACVQELWEAVMGKNPSEFKGAKRPVENVSWNDGMEFIEKINSMVPGLDLRLPTEAEWEYSCRAGTITPFSFGENITTDQVNYDGTIPYNDGANGEYREKTVDVKSFPCNEWGLYEMHGNVREWCSDWYGEYPEGSLVDPGGPDSGEYRVLRGGSWINDGRNVRSAFRLGDGPGLRYHNSGFRFAQGHKSQVF